LVSCGERSIAQETRSGADGSNAGKTCCNCAFQFSRTSSLWPRSAILRTRLSFFSSSSLMAVPLILIGVFRIAILELPVGRFLDQKDAMALLEPIPFYFVRHPD